MCVDDEARRLKKQWQSARKAAARGAFPLREAQLEALFRDVEARLQQVGCEHSQRLTLTWLLEHGIVPEPVIAWLDENGGYCDCEVVANAGEHFASNR